MKKIFKKVIVAVLAMTMILGMMSVMVSADTKDCTTTNDWVISGNFNSWGTTEMTALGDGRYYCTVTVDAAGNLQFYIKGTVDGVMTEVKGKDYTAETGNDFVFAVSEAGTYNIVLNPVDLTNEYWGGTYYINTGVSVSAGISASDVEAAIAAIGDVELTDACRALIDAAHGKVNAYIGSTDDISNYDDLADAEDAWAELVANGAGTLKVHVTHNWSTASVYTYGVSNGDAHAAGGWPGTALVADANNDGWGDVTVTTESAVNVIVNNGGNGKQSETKFVVAGEYWIVISNDEITSVSATAPEGWSTGVVTPPPSEETPSEETPSEETPSEEIPSEETPSEETPSEETPSEETPSEETPSEETPSEETPSEETPSEETPSEETPEEDTNTYHVAGAEGLCGVNWDPSKNQMTKNEDGTWSIKFTNVKAGKYEFKIATNGDWDNGEYNLEGSASNGGANAVIEVAEDGSTVIITFDGEKAIITMNEVPAGVGDDTPAGESTTVAIFAILALIAAAGVATVFVAKKRAIEE